MRMFTAIVFAGLGPGAALAQDGAVSETNPLQRAVWTCENAAPGHAAGTDQNPRFFLGIVDASADKADTPPLELDGSTLTGFGSLSTDSGWSNIAFSCALDAALTHASGFSYDTLSPIPDNDAPPPSGATANPDMTWSLSAGTPLELVHGVPETDDSDFRARCAQGSGKATISLAAVVPDLSANSYVAVQMSDGPGSGLYIARGVADDATAAVLPVAAVSADDPLWAWIARGQSLVITIGGEASYTVSLAGSAGPARNFQSACSVQ